MKSACISPYIALPCSWPWRWPIARLLCIVALLFFVNIAAKAQAVYSFPTTPTWIDYPGEPSWKQTAEVTIDGVVYHISNGGNGSWEHKLTGGNGNGTSLYFAPASDMTITIKRKDGKRFIFHDVWLKYTNTMGGLYQPPWLTVVYDGSSLPNDTYGANTTTHIKDKNVSVTSVALKYSGLIELSLDDLKVAPDPSVPNNSAPTDITLSNNSVNENVAAGTVIGAFSTIDPDVGDTFTYSLVSGVGSTDNHLFSLLGNMLILNTSPDYEAKNSYSVRIRTIDSGNSSFEKSFTILVIDVNDAPVVTTSAGTNSYTEGAAAVVVDAGITLTDQDNSTLSSATVAISGNLQTAEDKLSISLSSATMGNITASYDSGTGVMTLSSLGASATLAQWQAALRAVTYANTSKNPSTATRSINFSVNDGSLASMWSTKTVSLIAVNDAPVNLVPGAQAVNQDATLTFSTANNNLISITDVDAGTGSVRVLLTATQGKITLTTIAGLQFVSGANELATMTFEGTMTAINSALSGLVFTPTPGYSGPANIQIVTSDKGNTGVGGSLEDTDNIPITVNPINPKVVSVGTTKSNGTYKIADVIPLTVTFDQQVFVTGGTPTLELETGTIDQKALHATGNGTNILTFNYTVQAGDATADLDYTSTTALSLNGAAIKNAGNYNAILTLPAVAGVKSLGGQHAIVIDGVVPTVTSVTVPANGYYTLNQNLDFTINFSEAVMVNKTGGTPRLALDIAGQTVYASYNAGSGSTALVFRYTVATGLEDRNGITVGSLATNGGTIADAAGNNAALTLNAVGNTNGVKVDSKSPALTLSINTQATHTNNRRVDLLLLTGDGDLYEMRFSNDNISWSPWEPINLSKDWDLTAGEGTKTVYVSVRDIAGNTTEVNASIILDQTPPTVDGVAPNGLYKDDRTIFFNEGTATLNGAAFTSGATVTADDTYTIVVTDKAGNTTTIGFEIDKTAPVVSGVVEGKAYNSNRTITYNEGNATLNGATFTSGTTVSAEGSYVLVVTDAAGNSTTVSFKIDKTAPVVSGVVNGGMYNTNLTIDFNEGTATLNDVPFAPGTVVSMENSYVLVVTDAAGNSTTVSFSIDKTAPAVAADFTAQGLQSEIALSWMANREPDFKEYLLYVQPQGGTKTLLQTIAKGTESYRYTGLPNGTSYAFFLVTADQVGNRSAETTATATTMAEQTITFGTLSIMTYGDTEKPLTATASSALPVSYTSSNPAIASVYQDPADGNKWKVKAKAAGTVMIIAAQAGNNQYLPATAISQPLTIDKAQLTITADAQSKVFGEADPEWTYQVGGLVNNDSRAIITGKLSRAEGENAGSYAINKGSLDAGTNYTIDYTGANFSIRKAKQTISFTNPGVLARDAGTVALDVKSSAALPITLRVDDPLVATVSGTDLQVLRLGTVRITATQMGDENHEAAPAVEVPVLIAAGAGAKLPIVVHQAVSPNGDGINEFLIIEGIRDYPENKVTIFDKNGSVLAEIESYNNQNNVFTGKDSRDGTYHYFLDIKDNGVWKREKGYFVIRR